MKKALKERLVLSWHTLGFKHEELCEKLGIYLEAKKSLPTGSGLVPWRSRPEKTPVDPKKYLW